MKVISPADIAASDVDFIVIGSMSREPIRKHLETVLSEIQSGAFAKQWAEERAHGGENFERLRDLGRQANPFTPIEERIREAVRKAQERT